MAKLIQNFPEKGVDLVLCKSGFFDQKEKGNCNEININKIEFL